MIEHGGGRPTKGYFTAAGKRVPSTTTITGRFKASGGLVHWAWQCGVDGIDYRDRSKDAAAAGTCAHELIDADIHGREPDIAGVPPETLALGQKGFDAYRRWRDQTRMEVRCTELPLVSEEHLFGGTLDAVGTVNGTLVLIDWKSGARVYEEFIVQTGAYAWLWEENRPEQPLHGIELLRVGKEFGDFHHHSWPREVLDLGWQAFKLERARYQLDAPLKRAVG